MENLSLSESEDLNKRFFSTKGTRKYLNYINVLDVNEESKSLTISCKICVRDGKKVSTIKQSFLNGGTCNIRRHLRNHKGVLEELDSRDESENNKDSKLLNAITDFVVENAIAFRAVNSRSFKKLVKVLDSNAIVPDRKDVSINVSTQYQELVAEIKKKFDVCSTICGTLDIWTKNNKSFIGCTAHMIDPNTLERHNVTLSCRRIIGRHDFINIANIFYEILQEYSIVDKMKHCSSDQAANIQKTFRYHF